MGGEAEFSVGHVDQDVHIGSQSTELEDRTCDLKGVRRAATPTAVLEHRPGHSSAHTVLALRASMCACACAPEGRDCGTLLFHMPHRAQCRAQGRSLEASSGCPLALPAQGPAHCLTPAFVFITEVKLAPGHGALMLPAAPFPLEDNTRSPHRLTRQKRKPH